MSLRTYVIYVAGPFRAIRAPGSQWEQELNIRRAEEMALTLWALGFTVICPHLNTKHFQGELPDAVWLHGDVELLKRCDGALFLPGWHTSAGAKTEREVCAKEFLPVFDSVLECYEYFNARADLLKGRGHS